MDRAPASARILFTKEISKTIVRVDMEGILILKEKLKKEIGKAAVLSNQ